MSTLFSSIPRISQSGASSALLYNQLTNSIHLHEYWLLSHLHSNQVAPRQNIHALDSCASGTTFQSVCTHASAPRAAQDWSRTLHSPRCRLCTKRGLNSMGKSFARGFACSTRCWLLAAVALVGAGGLSSPPALRSWRQQAAVAKCGAKGRSASKVCCTCTLWKFHQRRRFASRCSNTDLRLNPLLGRGAGAPCRRLC